MGRAAQMKRNRRKYSILEPRIEQLLHDDGVYPRDGALFRKMVNSPESGVNHQRALNRVKRAYKRAHGDLQEYVKDSFRMELEVLYKFADMRPIFIDEPKMWDLFVTTKVPNIDVRSILNQIPHLTMSMHEYIATMPSSCLCMDKITSTTNSKDGPTDKDEDWYWTDHPEYFTPEGSLNITVHYLPIALFVPRACNKHVVSFYFRWFTYKDGNDEVFPFDSVYEREDKKSGTSFDLFSDVCYISTSYHNPDLNGKVVGVQFATHPTILSKEANKFAGKLSTKLKHPEMSEKDVNLMREFARLAINFVYYLNTYPELIQQGLPDQTVINDLEREAQRLVPSQDINFDYVRRAKELEASGVDIATGKKCPHYRAGHYRALKSNFYKNKRFQTLYIAPTFVHKDYFAKSDNSQFETFGEEKD